MRVKRDAEQVGSRPPPDLLKEKRNGGTLDLAKGFIERAEGQLSLRVSRGIAKER
jgi:hypothetical protein